MRKLYTEEEVIEIGKMIGDLTLRKSPKWDEREKAGFYTIERAAKLLRVPRVTLCHWIKVGRVERPARRFKADSLRYYNDEDLAEIKRLQAGYFTNRGLS